MVFVSSKEDILRLTKSYYESEKEMEKIGKKQYPMVVELSEKLGTLIEDIEQAKERGTQMEYADISLRIKLMKRGIKLSKGLMNFEKNVVEVFEEGMISEEMGKRFIAIIKFIKEKQLASAKEEFRYFEEIIELNKMYGQAKAEREKKDRILRREQHRIKKLLEETKELEKETVDLAQVQKYAEFLKNLERLGELRKNYIYSLVSRPVVELLREVEKHSLNDYAFPFIERKNLKELRAFFSENLELGNYTLSQLFDLFSYSEKKLSYIFPETSKFKRIVLSHMKWFETVHNLESAAFIVVDDENEKTMNFYADKIEGAKEIVEQIVRSRKEKNSCRKEYEKNKRIEEQKKKLSAYSKNELEKELNDVESLLGLLHSQPEEKNEKEETGWISKIESFFKTN